MVRNIWILLFALMLLSCSKGTSPNNRLNQTLISLDGDTLMMQQVLTHKSLVLRYSVLHCRSCIDSLFFQLRKIEKNIGKDNIVIFTYFNEMRDFVVSARLNKIHYNIYQVPNNEFFIPEDKLGVPYFFILDKDISVHDVFLIKDYHSQQKEISSYLNHEIRQFN